MNMYSPCSVVKQIIRTKETKTTKEVRVIALRGNEINEINEERAAARRWSVGESGLLPAAKARRPMSN